MTRPTLIRKCIPKIWLIILTATIFNSVTTVEAQEPLQVSSILAETLNHFMEKLQSHRRSDNSHDSSGFPQTRGGGYGGHGGGHGHGAITLDPVSIISLLALGAFLINNILQLLRANMNNNNNNQPSIPAIPGGLHHNAKRSMGINHLENLLIPPPVANGLSQSEPSFMDFFENVGSLYYLQPKKRHMCMKRVVCNYVTLKESREKTSNPLKTKIFDFMVSTVTKIVAPEIEDDDKEEKCLKMHKFCSDALLSDARVSVEYKIYSQVSSWLTKLAFSGLTSG